MPYLAFVVAIASVAAGDLRDAWIAALAGWFLIHGHVCLPALRPRALAGCRRRARLARRGPAGVVAVLLRRQRRVWMPVAGHQRGVRAADRAQPALHWPGEFGKYLSYSSKPGGNHLRQVVRLRAVVLVDGTGTRRLAGRGRRLPGSGPADVAAGARGPQVLRLAARLQRRSRRSPSSSTRWWRSTNWTPTSTSSATSTGRRAAIMLLVGLFALAGWPTRCLLRRPAVAGSAAVVAAPRSRSPR